MHNVSQIKKKSCTNNLFSFRKKDTRKMNFKYRNKALMVEMIIFPTSDHQNSLKIYQNNFNLKKLRKIYVTLLVLEKIQIF